MNAAKAPRRLSGRREDGLPSLPAPNSSGGGLSFVSSSSSSSSSRSRFASLLAEKKSDGYPSSFLGPVGGGNPGAAATPHKVWLGSLPSTLTESELRERLACFGTIQSFFFKPEQPGAAVLAADQPQQNKKARGWAFVSYSTAEEAQALIKAVDGKTPEAVFPVAASSLIAPGAAPPVEARLANASKNIASSGSLSTTTASDSRTVFSEEEPHSREKLLALAFFSPSHKPSAAGRASSLAPGRASSVAPSSSSGMTAAGDAAAAGNSSSSSLRCSSHPRINNSSSLDKLDGTGIQPGAGNGPVVGNNLSDFSGQSMNPRAGGAPAFSRSLMNSSHASYRGGPASNTGPAGGHQAVTELHKQHARLAEEEEEAPPPPAPTSFPLPPAGSGGNLGLSQLAANEKAAAMNAAANAAGGGGIPQKIQETAAMPSAAGDNGGAFPPPAAAAAPAPAPAGAAPAPGPVLAGAAPAPPSGGVSARAAALATPAPMDQPQQPALNGGGVAGAAAGAAAGADSGPQRGRRPYSGGPAGAAGLPLSGGGGAAAAGAAAPHIGGGHTARPQQQQPGRIDGPGLPSLWEVYWTPDTQQPYYYNALSKHVQWERPLPPRDYVEQYGNPMTEELGPPAPLIPGVTRGVVAGKGGAVVGPQGSNLFVFHLPPEWTEQTFLRHFAPFGNVVSCKIQVNNQTGKRGGFGFVSYDNPASAIASIRMLNGFAACGKMLKVQLKKGEEHLLPPDLLLQQQQQQQHQHPHGSHVPPTPPPLGFTYSAAA